MSSDAERPGPERSGETQAASLKDRLAAAGTCSDTSRMMALLAGCARDAASLTEATAVSKAVSAAVERLAGDRSVAVPRLSAYLAGNATLHPMASGILLGAMARGVVVEIHEAPYDQWAAAALDPSSDLYRLQPDFLVLFLSSLGLTAAGTMRRDDVVHLLKSCLDKLREGLRSRIVVVLPDPLEEERDPASSWAGWRSRLCDDIRTLCREEAVLVIDPAVTVMDLGAARWFAPRYWYHAKLPCHPLALVALGRAVGNSLAAALIRPKIVVCDLDNTLWGGILGEDGWHGLALDVHGSGGSYLRLQAFLKDLTARGFLLAAVSKNNEADVREAFARRREDMLLGWDDFVSVRAGWQPKSHALRELAEQLGLGLQSFVFLDDSPFERAEVRDALPEVVVPDLPQSSDDYVPYLLRSGLFEAPFVTAEDRHRNAYYRQNLARQEAGKAMEGVGDFLASIELEMEVLPVAPGTSDRVVQLLHKTNQFNLTTRRHDAETVAAMARDDGVFARCYRVRDRFGDNGITGVLIAVPDGPSQCRIDTWLLSCRVVGRTVEHAMFSTLCDWAAARGISRIIGEYRSTPKNALVAGLYRDLGFELLREGEQGILYWYDAGRPYGGNRHVRIKHGPDRPAGG